MFHFRFRSVKEVNIKNLCLSETMSVSLSLSLSDLKIGHNCADKKNHLALLLPSSLMRMRRHI